MSACRALLQEVFPSLVEVYISWYAETETIELKFYASSPPTEEDLDSIGAIETEMYADFLPGITIESECIVGGTGPRASKRCAGVAVTFESTARGDTETDRAAEGPGTPATWTECIFAVRPGDGSQRFDGRAWPRPPEALHMVPARPVIETDRVTILLSAQRALLGEIFPGLAQADISWDAETIKLKFYLSLPPTREDLDSMSSVEARVHADFSPDRTTSFEYVVGGDIKARHAAERQHTPAASIACIFEVRPDYGS